MKRFSQNLCRLGVEAAVFYVPYGRSGQYSTVTEPVQIVDSMPSIGKGQKVIAFGDFSNYWLVQRFPLTIRTLKEKFAIRGQVGYLGCEYLDGKLIRKDAVKVLQMAAD